MKTIFAFLASLIVSEAVMAADCIVVDGKKYRSLQPKYEFVFLEEGESISAEETCTIQKQIFDVLKTCVWQKTVTRTKNGGV